MKGKNYHRWSRPALVAASLFLLSCGGGTVSSTADGGESLDTATTLDLSGKVLVSDAAASNLSTGKSLTADAGEEGDGGLAKSLSMQKAAETAIAGLDVVVWSMDGKVLCTTQTAGDGSYSCPKITKELMVDPASSSRIAYKVQARDQREVVDYIAVNYKNTSALASNKISADTLNNDLNNATLNLLAKMKEYCPSSNCDPIRESTPLYTEALKSGALDPLAFMESQKAVRSLASTTGNGVSKNIALFDKMMNAASEIGLSKLGYSRSWDLFGAIRDGTISTSALATLFAKIDASISTDAASLAQSRVAMVADLNGFMIAATSIAATSDTVKNTLSDAKYKEALVAAVLNQSVAKCLQFTTTHAGLMNDMINQVSDKTLIKNNPYVFSGLFDPDQLKKGADQIKNFAGMFESGVGLSIFATQRAQSKLDAVITALKESAKVLGSGKEGLIDDVAQYYISGIVSGTITEQDLASLNFTTSNNLVFTADTSGKTTQIKTCVAANATNPTSCYDFGAFAGVGSSTCGVTFTATNSSGSALSSGGALSTSRSGSSTLFTVAISTSGSCPSSPLYTIYLRPQGRGFYSTLRGSLTTATNAVSHATAASVITATGNHELTVDLTDSGGRNATTAGTILVLAVTVSGGR